MMREVLLEEMAHEVAISLNRDLIRSDRHEVFLRGYLSTLVPDVMTGWVVEDIARRGNRPQLDEVQLDPDMIEFVFYEVQEFFDLYEPDMERLACLTGHRVDPADMGGDLYLSAINVPAFLDFTGDADNESECAELAWKLTEAAQDTRLRAFHYDHDRRMITAG